MENFDNQIMACSISPKLDANSKAVVTRIDLSKITASHKLHPALKPGWGSR